MEGHSDITTNSAMDICSPITIEEEPAPLISHPESSLGVVTQVNDSPNSNNNQESPTKSNNISLVNYEDTSDEYISSDDNEPPAVQTPSVLDYRHHSTESDSSSDSESDDSDGKSVGVPLPVIDIPRVKGELTIEDLPPIEDLTITVQEEETLILGKIQSIVDQLVVIQSLPGTSAVDIDSILFLEEGKRALGKVFDVIGPVREPLYCVRFNSNDHIKEKQICVGANVYYAPKTVHTSFIFLQDLLQVRGSDASWENDIEPPPKYLDYSDDEEERSARKGKKKPTEDVSKNQPENQNPEGSNSKQATNQKKLTNRERKRAMYRKNFNFPMNASPARAYYPVNQELFCHPFYNQANIPHYPSMMPPPMHQQFPNTGQSFHQPFPPMYNQINFNNGPSYSTNSWNANSAHSSAQNVDTTRPPPPLPSNPNSGGTNPNPPPPGTF